MAASKMTKPLARAFSDAALERLLGDADQIVVGRIGRQRLGQQHRQPVFQAEPDVDVAEFRRQRRAHMRVEMGDVDAGAVGGVDLGAQLGLDRLRCRLAAGGRDIGPEIAELVGQAGRARRRCQRPPFVVALFGVERQVDAEIERQGPRLPPRPSRGTTGRAPSPRRSCRRRARSVRGRRCWRHGTCRHRLHAGRAVAFGFIALMNGHRLAGTPVARVFQSVSRAAWNRPFAQLDAMERPKPALPTGPLQRIRMGTIFPPACILECRFHSRCPNSPSNRRTRNRDGLVRSWRSGSFKQRRRA